MGDHRRSAACLAVGSELLGGDKLDRNSLTVSRALAGLGLAMTEKRVVGDDVEAIAGAVGDLVARHDLVVVTGGLGPTADDVTRDAVARALGRAIEHDPAVAGWIRERYAAQGREMPVHAPSMARVVAGSRPLPNLRGAAPGLLVELGDRVLAVLPGPPWEMVEMLERDVLPVVASWDPGARRLSRTLLVGGVFESDVEQRVRPLYERFGRDDVSILASYGVVRLVLWAAGDGPAAMDRLGEMERAFSERLGNDLAGVDLTGLAEAAVVGLRRRGERLATAESCTGGLVSARLTDVPGASEVFVGGVVAYSNEVKELELEVPLATLVGHGAVSEAVARAMAEGARRRLAADWGVAITGIAGPTGGTEDKPVGLVHWAVAGPDGVAAAHRVFPGDRSVVREWSCNSALDLLRRRLAGLG
ncbi:MAG: CinA family nicotinamide mononucleotide deamidase-related protein [Thermoanaerobaculales bacterium]|jgi:nicotinamide-nucleotide amidase|nr:CinA family nicotinamide mononucleotide deamidase-related protein [Thermoanaerobaculales bacterium]